MYIHVALLDKFPQLGKFGIGGLNLPWRPNEEKLYPDSSMPKTLSHEQKKRGHKISRDGQQRKTMANLNLSPNSIYNPVNL